MSNIEPEDHFISEDGLKGVLERWAAPEPKRSLDQRVANSYYREFGRGGAVAESGLLPKRQNEVVVMKFCSTCKEEFADRFSFCPVDGTPLNGLSPRLPDKVTSALKHNATVVLTEPVFASAGTGTLAPRDEYHLTIIDDTGLISRLSQELKEVGHEYQLTWPDFKRDPFGFVKRSIAGYGQMVSKFFANRNVVLGLIVAALAMVGLVGIVGLLERAQPGGMSRTAFVSFALVAGVILTAIFTTWLRKSQSGAVLGAPDSESNNAVIGMVAAFSVFLFLVGGGVLYNLWLLKSKEEKRQLADELVVQQYIDIPNEQPTPDPGTAGLNKGSGGGSKPKPEKAGGGGGGGREEQKPASFGKPPQASLTVPQVVAPDPKPPAIKNPSLPVAATVVADPLLVPPDARVLPYGDFKSKSTDPSSGPGTGNGIGTGKGGGIGPGEGGGIGPGRGGNIGGGDRNDGGGGPGGGGGGYGGIFSGKDVTQKARVLSKPEPTYTEEARKNQITGTVVLRAVFTSGGQVSNIRSVSGLPFGLTERAIAAARQIKFVPAIKDGHPVSMYIQLEYNFNLY